MEFMFTLLTTLATIAACLAQQQQHQQPQGAVAQGPSAPLLGVRYSAATDVSHVSFNSPLATYGSSLNEIQLPAAPIKPSNLKQAVPQAEAEEDDEATAQSQTSARSFRNEEGRPQQLLQSASAPANQPQFLSVQQYPANPQLQSTPQGFSLSQRLPEPQPQNIARPPLIQPPQRTVQPQYTQYPLPYYSSQPQQPYVLPPQQYAAPHQSQQVQYSAAPQAQQYPSSALGNGYFATGPYAAHYPQPNLFAEAQPQYAQGPVPQYPQAVPAQYPQAVASQYPQAVASQYPQAVRAQYPHAVAQQYPQAVSSQYGPPVAPEGQLVSRVAFNGPVGGFSYSF